MLTDSKLTSAIFNFFQGDFFVLPLKMRRDCDDVGDQLTSILHLHVKDVQTFIEYPHHYLSEKRYSRSVLTLH
jgi:hypothetical protein